MTMTVRTIADKGRSSRSGRGSKNLVVPRVIVHIVLIALGVTLIVPLLWMVSVSLQSPADQLAFPPRPLSIPLYFGNFVQLFKSAPIPLYLFNTLKIAVLSVLGTTLASSLAGYAFARLRFPGQRVVFAILMASMLIPGQVTLIPTFVLMRLLGWIDTHAALIVPSLFGTAFNVFLLRQFFRSIPQDLVDAARIDGASHLRIWWSIFMPLAKPALATVALLSFLGSWNDLLGPLIFLNSDTKMTLTQGLTLLSGKPGTATTHWGVMMAGGLITMIPILILYLIAQRSFVEVLARSGLKG
jgi:multiple sugar transport system permease protein